MIVTAITQMLDIGYPVMSAPMSLHSGGRLAAAVSVAGGLGTFGGTNPAGPEWIREQIQYVRSQTDRPFGVGFISHLNAVFPDDFEVALEERVPVMAFSFGDPTPWLVRAKDNGAMVMCQVQSLRAAQLALDAGADILVAQGNEAGGHTGETALLPLLSALLDRYPETPIMAAGGIGSGRSLAAVLSAGASGAWMGTAFMATPECVEVPDSYKERIVRSDGEDTVYTEVFDILDPHIFGIPPWPEGIAARAYSNGFVREWHGKENELRQSLEQVVPGYLEAMQRRDPEVCGVYFGPAAAHVSSVRPAAEVLSAICQEAERLLGGRLASSS